MFKVEPANYQVGDYAKFLKSKEIAPQDKGFSVPLDQINPLLFDWQRETVQWALKTGRAAFFFDCGLGKGFPARTLVMTPSGEKPIGQIKVGDPIIGSDGLTHKVTGVYPRGEQSNYRISFSDGTSIVCDDDHLWNVMSTNDKARGKGYRTMSTRELRQSKIRYGAECKSRTWQIPLTAPVQFEARELPLHPYVLGVLLGDGSLDGTPRWSKPDEEIARKIETLLPEGMKVTQGKSDTDNWTISNQENNPHVPNKVTQIIKALGLFGKSSPEKFVPTDYIYTSVENRIALLQGLMDTDGYAGQTPEFCSTSYDLARTVYYIVQSLGGTANIAVKESPTYMHNGEKRLGQRAYRVTMSMPEGINPFSLARKANAFNTPSRGVGRWIDSIEYVGQEATICIKVDAPDELFVVQDFIVTHNTAVQLTWAHHVAKHTNKPVLILAPLAVAQQTVREGVKFNVPVTYAKTQSEMSGPVVITNYERLDNFDTSIFGGVVLDESSVLKAFSGVIKQKLLKRFESTPYRLACTATPAPNDYLELGNHSEFLGVLKSNEMLVRWFINYTQEDGSAMGKYRVKGHAVESFWDWVCTWARCVGKPSDLSDRFSDKGYVLPPLSVETVQVKVDTQEGRGDKLWREPSLNATDLHKEKRRTTEARVKEVGRIVELHKDEPVLIWADTDYEAEALMSLVPGLVEVHGADKPEAKEKSILDFVDGRIKRLLTKPKLAAFGLNFQHCAVQIFVGASYSYESFYQAIRRSWRFGQEREVKVYIIVPETESQIWNILKKKEEQHETMKTQMFTSSKRANERSATVKVPYNPTHKTTLPSFINAQGEVQCLNSWEGKDWKLYNADCVDLVRQLPSNSVGYAIYSPPFANLYTYSDSLCDMGNCADDDEFFENYFYMIKELYRVMKPGRIVSVHCKNLVDYKGRDGRAGIRDFRGELIRCHEAAGFKYHTETVIWKDPVIEMQRTKAHGLLYKQLRADGSFSRQGLGEYLLGFRKWAEEGEEIDPVVHNASEFSVHQWQKWASPVWMNIQQTKVLNGQIARDDKDEKHICPLQLEVIERGVVLWSNPGDVVLSPFTGIGSEGHEALRLKRKFIGIELKDAYCKHAITNLNNAGAQMSLF